MFHNTDNILGTEWNSSSHNNHSGGKNMYLLFGQKKKKKKPGVGGEESPTHKNILISKNKWGTDICVMSPF